MFEELSFYNNGFYNNVVVLRARFSLDLKPSLNTMRTDCFCS